MSRTVTQANANQMVREIVDVVVTECDGDPRKTCVSLERILNALKKEFERAENIYITSKRN